MPELPDNSDSPQMGDSCQPTCLSCGQEWYAGVVSECFKRGKCGFVPRLVRLDDVIRIVSEHPEYPEPCPMLHEVAAKAAAEMDKEWVMHMVREACRQTKEAILADLNNSLHVNEHTSLTEGELRSEQDSAQPQPPETTEGQGLCVSPCSAFFFCAEGYGINELGSSLNVVIMFWIFVIGIVGITMLYPSKFRYLSSPLLLIFAHCYKACCHGACFVRFIPKFSKQICKIIARRFHIRKLRFKLLIGRLHLRYLLLKKFSIVHTGGWKKFVLPNVRPLATGESAADRSGKPL